MIIQQTKLPNIENILNPPKYWIGDLVCNKKGEDVVIRGLFNSPLGGFYICEGLLSQPIKHPFNLYGIELDNKQYDLYSPNDLFDNLFEYDMWIEDGNYPIDTEVQLLHNSSNDNLFSCFKNIQDEEKIFNAVIHEVVGEVYSDNIFFTKEEYKLIHLYNDRHRHDGKFINGMDMKYSYIPYHYFEIDLFNEIMNIDKDLDSPIQKIYKDIRNNSKYIGIVHFYIESKNKHIGVPFNRTSFTIKKLEVFLKAFEIQHGKVTHVNGIKL